MSEVAELLNLAQEPLSVNQKTEALKLAFLHLKKVDAQSEKNTVMRSGSFIVSAFSTALVISGFALMPPVVGAAIVSAAVVSAGGTLVTLTHEIFTERQGSEQARILRAVLASRPITQWAKLWSLTDTSTFLMALELACQGQLQTRNGKELFYHDDGKHPFVVAHEWILASQPQDSILAPTLPQVSPQTPREKGERPSTLTAAPLPPDVWTPDLMSYPSILIYGAPGAGKTSTAAWLIRERINAGHQIKVLDPHRAYGQWDGLECIGGGMDYDAINAELKSFTEEIKARYKSREVTPNYDPPKLTLVCDEFTQWSKKCSQSATFFEESLTDIRKVNLHVLFVGHGRTLITLGGSSGLADARDAALLELELEAQVDPETKKATPKLLGWLKYPSVPISQRQRVTIAPWMNGGMDFTELGVTSTIKEQPQESALPAGDNDNDIRQRLEALIRSTPQDKVIPESDIAKKLLEIIQAATKYPITFESIRKSRKWENNAPDKASLIAALTELSEQWIFGNESEGYYLKD